MYDVLVGGSGRLVTVIGTGAGLTLGNPFSKEIYLTSFHVAGTRYSENIEQYSGALKKDSQVSLLREQSNEYDEYAILIKDTQGNKLGYMPKKMNHIPARLMDAGKLIYCKVIEVAKNEYGIDIHLEMYMKD